MIYMFFINFGFKDIFEYGGCFVNVWSCYCDMINFIYVLFLEYIYLENGIYRYVNLSIN